MIATVEKYKEITKEELLKILIKFEFLNNFFYIFPSVLDLDIDDDVTKNLLSNKLYQIIKNQQYYDFISSIFDEQFIKFNIELIVIDIFSKLNSLNEKPFSFYKNLANLVPNIDIPQFENNKVYSNFDLNTIFLEKYISINFTKNITSYFNPTFIFKKDRDILFPRQELDQIFFSMNEISQNDVKNVKIGVRLIYLPEQNIDLSNLITQQENKEKIFYKRTFFRKETDGNNTLFFNPVPLVVSEREITFADLNNNDKIDSEFFILKRDLYKNSIYEKYLKFILPISVFNSILLLEHMNKEELLKQITDKNKIFKDIKDSALKALERVNDLTSLKF